MGELKDGVGEVTASTTPSPYVRGSRPGQPETAVCSEKSLSHSRLQ